MRIDKEFLLVDFCSRTGIADFRKEFQPVVFKSEPVINSKFVGAVEQVLTGIAYFLVVIISCFIGVVLYSRRYTKLGI